MRRETERLQAMYRAMREHFGHQDWWPGDTPLEICVGAILTQNTNWRNVERAIANLKRAGKLSVRALHEIALADLAELIRPAGYFNVKARRLKHFIAMLAEDWRGRLARLWALPTETLRETLLAVHGIGAETADSMILYAAGKASFVVDAYTCRVLRRHGLIQPRATYEQVRGLFETSLPKDVPLWNDFHAQFVAVGKYFCRPKARCEGCPLARFRHDPDR